MKKIIASIAFFILNSSVFSQVTQQPVPAENQSNVEEETIEPQNTQQEDIQETYNEQTAAGDPDPAGPWLICEIEIDGLINVKKRLVTKQVQAKKNKFYEMEDIQEDMSALSSLGYFDETKVDITKTGSTSKIKGDVQPCHKIAYIVTEIPQIKKINLEGRKKLSKGKVYGAMTLKAKDPFNASTLRQDLIKVKDTYKEKGYISTKVNYKTDNLPDENKVLVTVILDEGPRARVKEVEFEGIDYYPYKKIVGKTKNKPGKVYREEKLPKDKEKISSYYRNRGFHAFEIESQETVFNEEKSEVNIKYLLKEGPKTVFGKTTFSGNTVLTDEELVDAITYKEGKTYKESQFARSMYAIQTDKYGEKGYLKAAINPVYTVTEDNKLDIELDITESDIVYVGDVDVTGFKETTKKYVFTRELLLKEDDVFNLKKMIRSTEKIKNLGFIDMVRPDISNNP
ncbi:MAG TPA: POTRA domain-containing protein, partial [Elusimicrobiales bacterium]|nr:POTRA domain-containing protein [Elusimicrobiales bacterium]